MKRKSRDGTAEIRAEIRGRYYSCNSLIWNDLLTSYDGKEITYDNAGNPISYNGKTFKWSGKQLTQITAADGSKTQFEYDANGIRTRKLQYDEAGKLSYYVDYVWEDGKITTQYITLIMRGTIGNKYVEAPIGPFPSKIIYDDNDIPQGFIFGEASFAFVRNLQGDAIALVDSDGNAVMEYSYDPWGNIEYSLSEDFTEEDAVIFTALCPLTYRGYNYDFTTGLYYLQSRYYNPEWGRFLNCDDTNILLATQGEIHGANLFAYCDNNPVNRVDYYGCYSLSSIDFKSDWAGREILKHYLTGNGKAFNKSSSKWASYMNNSPICKICNTCNSKSRNSKYLKDYILKYIFDYKNKIENAFYGMKYSKTIKIDARLQNGESIIGYNYLHGVNKNVGSLQVKFTLTKQKPQKSNEKYRIYISAYCEWNDIIDPNLKYSSDAYKAALATKIPFVKPKDYQLKISWSFTTTYIEYSRVSIK